MIYLDFQKSPIHIHISLSIGAKLAFLVSPMTSTKQVSADSEPGTLSDSVASSDANGVAQVSNEDQELVEQETRDRFKRMCEGYFESVSKKLLIEHKVFWILKRASFVA